MAGFGQCDSSGKVDDLYWKGENDAAIESVDASGRGEGAPVLRAGWFSMASWVAVDLWSGGSSG